MIGWPASVMKFSQAVAKAEGFGIPGAVPTLANNPGDLTGADAGSFQTLGIVNKEGVLKFANVSDGWQALYIKFNRILSGRSLVYPLVWTIEEVGAKYSGGDPDWAVNVAKQLGVPISMTLLEWLAQNPLE